MDYVVISYLSNFLELKSRLSVLYEGAWVMLYIVYKL